MTTTGTQSLPVRCVGLRHVYHVDGGDLTALHGLNLDISAGSTTAIIGPSGSGKSTLVNLIAGLERPTAGQVHVGADDLAALTQSQLLRVRAERVGVVVQDPTRNLLPFADPVENIRFAQRGPRSYARHRELPDPVTLLADLGLDHLADTPIDRLSGGERQRLALAVGIAAAPGVLLTDEPTSQLDTTNRDRVVDLLRLISRRFHTTVIAVTHDPDVAAGLSRSIGLHEGHLVSDTAS